jgi:hypothetical protein
MKIIELLIPPFDPVTLSEPCRFRSGGSLASDRVEKTQPCPDEIQPCPCCIVSLENPGFGGFRPNFGRFGAPPLPGQGQTVHGQCRSFNPVRSLSRSGGSFAGRRTG